MWKASAITRQAQTWIGPEVSSASSLSFRASVEIAGQRMYMASRSLRRFEHLVRCLGRNSVR